MAQSFWAFAQANPDSLALVEPSDGGVVGKEWKAGELLASCNQVVHGLRALGLTKGDCIAVMLPNGAALIELYLAALQGGFYLTPINHHLAAPEISYIVQDCEAKAFVADARFATTAKAAMDELSFAANARYALGEIPGFRSYPDLKKGQPTTLPDDRAAGSVMFYTSGTTGRPKGVRRGLAPIDPDTVATLFGAFLGMFGIKAGDGNVHLCGSPLYHTAVLTFASCSLHMGHTLVLMEKWTARSPTMVCSIWGRPVANVWRCRPATASW